LFERFSSESRIPTGEEREELLQIVKAAIEARNGWKRILKMCSEETKSRAASIRAELPGV